MRQSQTSGGVSGFLCSFVLNEWDTAEETCRGTWIRASRLVRELLLVGLALLLCGVLAASAAQGNVEWQYQYQGAGSFDGQCVLQTADGGYLIVGTDTIANGSSICLLKTDANGAREWQNEIGNNDGCSAAVQADDGGFVILGSATTVANGSQAILVKTDANGDVVWQKPCGKSGFIQGQSIRRTADGGYIIAGEQVLNGIYRACLVKTDANGTVEWQNGYGDTDRSTYGFAVDVTREGGYIISGSIEADGQYGVGTRVYLAKATANGTMEWQSVLGEALPVNMGRSVRQTPDGGYITAGTAAYEGETSSGIRVTEYTIHVVKTSANGTRQWEQWFGDTGSDPMYWGGIGYSEGYAVECTADGGYAVAGYTRPELNHGDYPPIFGSYQAYLAKMYANGSEQWQAYYGGDDPEYGYSLIQARDGGYVIAGTVDSADKGRQAYLIKTYGDMENVPVAGFLPNVSTGMAPLMVQFTDTSTGSPAAWNWGFGDGTPNATTQNVNHTFTKPGTFNVVLTVSNGSMASTASRQIVIRSSRVVVDPKPGIGTYTSISEAIAHASAGDLIVVNSGYYRESLLIDRRVELAGVDTGNGMPVVDAGGAVNAVKITADGVAFHGFSVTGAGTGIFMASNGGNVSYNHAYNNTYNGIEIYRYGGNVVSGNVVDNNGVGIYLFDTDNNRVAGNSARGGHTGIGLTDSGGNAISANSVDHNDRFGISLANSSGNTVSANSASDDGIYGISLGGSSGNTLAGNTANGNFAGIYLAGGANDNRLSGNTMNGNSVGAYVYYGSRNRIEACTANGNHYGYMLYGSEAGELLNNTASGNDHCGIQLCYSSGMTLWKNNLSDNAYAGIMLSRADGNLLAENIAHNDHYGIYLSGAFRNNVSGNTADGNAYDGLVLYGSGNNTVAGNLLSGNGYGIYLHSSEGNVLSANMLLNNTRSASVKGGANAWNSTAGTSYMYNGREYVNYTGNYWSDYRGTDANGDGIGDTPYALDANNIDRYPMFRASTMKPVKNMRTGSGYDTVQAAIDDGNTTDGDTITVNSGAYPERIEVRKPVRLVGVDTGNGLPAINGYTLGINVTANGVFLQGFNLTGCSITVNSDNNTITGNTIDDDMFALYVHGRDNRILENTILHSGTAIYIDSPDNRVEGNTVSGNHIGIEVRESASSCTILGNTADKNFYGIWIVGPGNNVTENKASFNNNTGIRVEWDSNDTRVTGNTANNNAYNGIMVDCERNFVSGNSISYNGAGIFVAYNCFNSTIADNTVYGNGDGINVAGSFNEITGNTVRSNALGIFTGSGRDNAIWLNVVDGNRQNGSTNDGVNNHWNSTVPVPYTFNGTAYTRLAGNYWGDYKGRDANGDGIGDTPYGIGYNNSDRYPMMPDTTGVTAYKAYVTNFGSGNISLIETRTDTIATSIAVETGPSDVAFTPDGKKAYVTHAFTNNVSVIDTATNTVVGVIDVKSGQRDVEVTPDGKKAYVANQMAGIVSVIDTATDTVTAAIDTGNPVYMAITPDGRYVYVTNAKCNNLSVIDAGTDRIVASIGVGEWPGGVAISPDGKKVYVSNVVSNNISVIDTTTQSVTASIDFGYDSDGQPVAPDYLSFSPVGNLAYVCTTGNMQTVAVVDTATDAIVSTIWVGGLPQEVAFTPDGKKAYVTNLPDYTSVIDVAGGQVIATIHGGESMAGIAIH